MKYTYENAENLTKPGDFELVTEQDLFESLVNDIEYELNNSVSRGTYYDKSDECVKINIKNDEIYSRDVIESVYELFAKVGWYKIEYSHIAETDDDEAQHIFKFYFYNSQNVSL